MATGKEGGRVFTALLESLQSDEDHGAYQSTFRALHRFPPRVFARTLVGRLPALIQRNRDWAGEILCGATDEALVALNRELAKVDNGLRNSIMTFVREEEQPGGWLEECAGSIRPSADS
jgi:hypothetical protein